jgi:mRNA interferase YafQ
MRSLSYSSQFHRDVKRLQKRGKDLEKLKNLIELLLACEPLPARYKDHPLKLNWAGYRRCTY